jgi:hypothetical protein
MEHVMPTEKKPDVKQPSVEQEPDVPKPPTSKAVEEISQQQALITDEWTGNGPGGAIEHSVSKKEKTERESG